MKPTKQRPETTWSEYTDIMREEAAKVMAQPMPVAERERALRFYKSQLEAATRQDQVALDAYDANPIAELDDAIEECKRRREALDKAYAAKDVEQIDVETIQLIYGEEKQQERYINLMHKQGGDMKNLAGIRVSELREYLPTLIPFLLQDAYCMYNAAYRSEPWRNRRTGLPAPTRGESNLAYLNVCYADLDCHDRGMLPRDALHAVREAEDAKLIPTPSIIVESGRGVYLLWMLVSERKGYKQKAFPPDIALWKKINKALIGTLNQHEPRLGADYNANTNAEGVLRLLGSFNSKSDTQVRGQVNFMSGGKVPTYTMPQLADMYGIKVIPYSGSKYIPWQAMFEHPHPWGNKGSAPKRARGPAAKAAYRYQDLIAIAQHQGGITKGHRRHAITCLSWWGKQQGWTLSQIKNAAMQFAATCNPPYPSADDDDVADVVMAVWVAKGGDTRRGQTLATRFKVTDAMADELGLLSIIPKATADRREAVKPRATARQARQEHIRGMIAGHGTYPTVRHIESSLDAAGLHAAKGTISADLHAVLDGMGIPQKSP